MDSSLRHLACWLWHILTRAHTVSHLALTVDYVCIINASIVLLWSPYVIGQTIIFLPCDFFLSIFFLFFLSSPNLSGRRLDVYHTSTHGVALVQIQNAGLKPAARGSLKIQDARKSPKITILQYCFTCHPHISSQELEMWANAQRDGRPAERRLSPLFNAAKFG